MELTRLKFSDYVGTYRAVNLKNEPIVPTSWQRRESRKDIGESPEFQIVTDANGRPNAFLAYNGLPDDIFNSFTEIEQECLQHRGKKRSLRRRADRVRNPETAYFSALVISFNNLETLSSIAKDLDRIRGGKTINAEEKELIALKLENARITHKSQVKTIKTTGQQGIGLITQDSKDLYFLEPTASQLAKRRFVAGLLKLPGIELPFKRHLKYCIRKILQKTPLGAKANMYGGRTKSKANQV